MTADASEPKPAPSHGTTGFYAHGHQDRPISERAAETPARHVWVATTAGHVPGLLLAWEKRAGAWHGHVVHLQRGQPGSSPWVMVLDWVPAGRIIRA